MLSKSIVRRILGLCLLFLFTGVVNNNHGDAFWYRNSCFVQTHNNSSLYAAYFSESTRQDDEKEVFNFFSIMSMESSGVELWKFLDRYSERYGFSYFIDRRVDPSTILSGAFVDQTFITILEDLLEKVELSFCVVNNSFLYIGPRDSAGEALLLFHLKREQFNNPKNKIPRLIIEKLNSEIDFTIEEYALASEVFGSFAKRSRLKFSGYDKTPFDRWRGGTYKNVIVSDMLVILGLGFNVDYQYDSKTGTIKPIPYNMFFQEVTRYYPRVLATQIDPQKHPRCEIREESLNGENVIKVTGTFYNVACIEYEFSQIRRKNWSEQVRIEFNGNSPLFEKESMDSTSEYSHMEVTGTVLNKSLRDLFAYLKNSTNIKCVLDPSMKEVGITMDSKISCEFKNSDIDDIAQIIASKIGSKTNIQGSKITFFRKNL